MRSCQQLLAGLISLVIRILWISDVIEGNTYSCEQLRPTPNVDLSCSSANNSIGTVCIYKCKPYYVSFENNAKQDFEIKCGSKGLWTDLKKFREFSCREDCGHRITNPKPLVVNGVPTSTSSWPWHVALFIKSEKTNSWVFICGGSLIRSSVVLTAAHCVWFQGEVLNPGFLRAVVGAVGTNLTFNYAAGAQVLEVKRIIVSKSYDPKKEYQADIALLHLSDGAAFNDYVRPVCLPNDYTLDLNALTPGRLGHVVGFGVDESKNLSRTLKHGQLLVVSQAECYNSLQRVLSESQFCAGNRARAKWITVCNGDSGGGFVFPSPVVQKYYIHGIVSTGDEKVNGLCQNYAVFTRVFQFIFWIYEILEQISGEVLVSNAKYPYINHGSELMRTSFIPFPREWENLITSIELLYIDIEPNVFFKSLDYSRGVQFLNFSHVRFTKDFESRVVLLHLKTFSLDLYDCPGIYVKGRRECQDGSIQFTKSYIKSLLFFDKEFGEEWSFDQLTHLKTDIQLISYNLKIIQLNVDEGNLVLRIPFGSEILNDLSPEFQLRHLALSKCELNMSKLLIPKIASSLRSLVLDDVVLTGELSFREVVRDLKGLGDLKIILNPAESENSPKMKNQSIEYIIYLQQLPRSLKNLALTRTSIEMSRFDALYSSAIQFPGATSDSNFYFANLDSFYCDHCDMSAKVVHNFYSIFRNIKFLVLCGESKVNITLISSKLPKLKWIYMDLADASSNNSADITFVGRENFINEVNSSTKQFLIVKRHGNWVIKPSHRTKDRMLYEYSGIKPFYTSPEDYEAKTRLSSLDLHAFRTGNYKFDGGRSQYTRLAQMPIIPEGIQKKLRTIEVTNAEVVPGALIESINSAENLESLILNQVYLVGSFETLRIFEKLRVYELNRYDIHGSEAGVHFITELSFEDLLPFGRNDPSLPQGLIGTFRYIPRLSEDPVNMDYILMRTDDCVRFAVDYNEKSLRSSLTLHEKTMRSFNESSLTNLSLRLVSSEWYTLSIPRNLSVLNLYHVYETDEADIGEAIASILDQAEALTALRLILLKSYNEANRTIVNLSNLRNFENSLRALYLNGVDLRSNTSIRLNLEMLFIESCVFDDEIVDRFWEFFQLKKLAIVSYGYQANGEEQNTYRSVNEKILLGALKNSRIDWILGYLGPYMNITTKYTEEIVNILELAGVPSNEVYSFIIERFNGSWKYVNIGISAMDEGFLEQFSLETENLRGDTLFGRLECSYYSTFPNFL